ncbi:LysR family transcriptional regulator [Xanthobacter agilis]|uniref:DNA-binding transcriptional LysR family regulator n=1 Tax=Xanthobacter agilis TaxID=47492 RepID=A0ABU0L910_XANAG|nr:LysR family transcriptional regulator [Xanthobacter agilis]MDQ0503623.1 DNA-binding transcriptional LysR family regulator [Xanthobacter agilis]
MFPSTFRKLHVFVTVVEAGSFAAAAERLGISHPSVSNHIQALERQTRSALFLRRKGTMSSLTEQGRRLYERGLELLDKAEALSRELALATEQVKLTPLAITCQRGLAPGWLCAPFAEFAKNNRNIDFSVNTSRYETVVEDLQEGRSDIGLLLAHGVVPDLPCEPVGEERFSFFAAPDHPLASCVSVAPAELRRHPFITSRRAGRFGQMVHAMLTDAGVEDYAVAYQVQEGLMVQELAIRGLGIFCGPDQLAEGAVTAGTLVRLPVEGPRLAMTVHCALSPKRKPIRAALAFAQYVRSHHAKAGLEAEARLDAKARFEAEVLCAAPPPERLGLRVVNQ